jgi:integrase
MPFTLRKRGKVYHARGTIPYRQEDGKISYLRHEESTREESRARAIRVAQSKWDYYHELAYKPKPKVITFNDAALTYVKTKGPSKRDKDFVDKLCGLLGPKPISEIDQEAVANACSVLYPGAKASTLHRAVYAPVTLVLRLSGIAPKFEKPKIQRPQLKVPDDKWFDTLLPHCEPQLRALIIFLSLTGRRITETLTAIDNGDGTCTIPKTKAGKTIIVNIPSLCLTQEDYSFKSGPMFTYGDRHNVYRALKRACKKAGVPVYGTHALGRHSFATRLLKKGYTLKHVSEAGGWASTKMVDLIYGHLEKSFVQDETGKVGEAWLRDRLL